MSKFTESLQSVPIHPTSLHCKTHKYTKIKTKKIAFLRAATPIFLEYFKNVYRNVTVSIMN